MTTSAERIQQLLTERDVLRKRLRAHHKAHSAAMDDGKCMVCLEADSDE